jgi:hypothetical protein
MLARHDEKPRATPREPIERGLRPRACRPVVDPAGRLVENADDRDAEPAGREGGSRERGCDRVEKDGARAELPRAPKHGPASESGKREFPLGKGDENDPRPVFRRSVGHPQVVEIAPAQAVRIA